MTKQMKIVLGIVAVLAVIGAVLYPKLVVTLPNDGADAKTVTFRGVRGLRYTEMFLIGGNAITKDLKANVYNTFGLNGGGTAGDSCPAAMLDKVDIKSVKERYGVLASFKNGPRMWTLDWFEGATGKELDFDGMKARWVNWLDLKGLSTKPGEASYKNITVGRHTKFGFDKGKQVFILEDPEGNPWVMKSFSQITHPDQKFEELPTLGSRLKLPAGWKFRAPVLEQELVLTPDKDGIAHITQDDFGNTYDRAGGPYSNFKP
ncbi:MAG: hypothetical protein MUQ56_12940 [Thermoleophilia bacterium]|nr:hypothetical protein [Thermoleophilia bacterium]